MKDHDDLRRVEDLMWLADYLSEHGDPCGASLIRWAAHRIENDECARCKLEYGRGYNAGYKTGTNEWAETPRKEEA